MAESDGIFWITSQLSRNILAYQQDGSRLSSRDITAHSNNSEPTYLWTNGETLWSTDAVDDRLYAYQLSDGSRQNSREFDLTTNNTSAAGIWSNGTTIWVADREDHRVYAYTLDGGARQETREFDLHSDNDVPTGIWSDGYTIWVGGATDEKLYAYTLHNGDKEPQPGLHHTVGGTEPVCWRHLVRRDHHVGGGLRRRQGLLLQHAPQQ